MDIKITDVREQKGDSAFLIDDGKTAILYDSGFAFTGNAVAKKIRRELGDRQLDYIFLTHSHYDHALGSCYVLKEYPNAKVVAGSYATKIFAKPTAKAVMRDLDKKFATVCGVVEYEDLIDNLKVDIAVDDGDEIVANTMKFTAISLPGHTKCSVGFYCMESKLLLSCETLGVTDGKGVVLPVFLVGYDMALSSIKRAQELDVEYVLVPHFGLLDKEQSATYLKKAELTAKKIASEIVGKLKAGEDKEVIVKQYLNEYWNGYIKDIYPEDAIRLNTGIMINLLEHELVSKPTVD
ncbi:MAG: MBL fold metallo-hydrolase [Clostridiales bacterium]|nr:MBL fold metallo-hydrolase [Clostridiales bacterium]